MERVFSHRNDKAGKYNIDLMHLAVMVLDENNKIIAIKLLQKDLQGSFSFEQKMIGHFSLDNVKDIYRVGFNGEACAVPSLKYYMAWTGFELIELLERRSVADAGVYYYNEGIVFPTEEGGETNTIFKFLEEATMTDNEKDNWEEKKTWKETYVWNGHQLIKKQTSNKKITKKKII
jgi:hypothetical protein